MLFNQDKLEKIREEVLSFDATLVVVSKTKSVEVVKAVFDAGQRIFGENYVKELTDKAIWLPTNIQWHFIGHLQSNKVKQIAPFISLIHGIDSLKLLQRVNKDAAKENRVIDCLLQIHIAQEETKYGLSFDEAEMLLQDEALKSLTNICLKGLMGMATLTDNKQQIRSEFRLLSMFFQKMKSGYSGHQAGNIDMKILSMGMTSDYLIALEEGSNMVRIGSAIMGSR